MKARARSKAPAPQRQKSTPANKAERKTARPSPGRAKLDTPRVAIAPPVLERKKAPRF